MHMHLPEKEKWVGAKAPSCRRLQRSVPHSQDMLLLLTPIL